MSEHDETDTGERLCERCHQRPGEWGPCPYDKELCEGYDGEECFCCSECRHECAMDI